MSREEFAEALRRLAVSLESSLSQTTSRIEHVRVAAQAHEARRLAEVFDAAGRKTESSSAA